MMSLFTSFTELISTPFQYVDGVWGVVPLYFGLLLNEMTSGKANYRTAIQTGFSFLWAGAQWLYPYYRPHEPGGPRLELGAMLPVNLLVTLLVIAFGLAALVSGVRRKYPRYASFLGHTRFANYFMIMIFAIQARYLEWSWEYLITIVLFAVPTWLLLHYGLMPIRNRKK